MANQILNNLKSIHNLHVSGDILDLLRDLRSNKAQLDDLGKKLSSKAAEKKSVSEKVHETNTVEEPKSVQVTNINEPVNNVNEPKKEEIKEDKPASNNFSNNENRTNYTSNQRTYNNTNNQNRPFNNNFNRPNNNQGFRNNNNNFAQNRPGSNFNNQSRPNNGFNNQNRQNGTNQNRPFNNNFNRPNNNFNRPNGSFNGQNNSTRPTGGNSKFMSTKTNNFRSFNTPLESSSVLAQPERSFGNKNKTKSYVDEKKPGIKKAQPYGRNYNNVIIEDENGFEEARMGSRKLTKAKKKEAVFVAPQIDKAVITTETVSVKTLSEKIGKPVTDIIKQLMLLEVMATINSTIDFTTAELVSNELGIKLEQKLDKTYEEKLIDSSKEEEDADATKRPPVVTVMGHVDHGKTSLLDALRKTNVVAGEAGGITQKIGAYQIEASGEKITFIDTPGHAAFTSMRARGANITDIAILVVAADDGIMPQTIEAINHIKAANVPMIVAINKMDKPEANPDRIKQQLSEHGILPEDWGGDAIIVPISAKTGMGIDNLVKMILLVAELQDLKASKNKMATGVVIEAELDKNRGPVATILVQSGTLNVGDNIISGLTYGKVKAMYDEHGQKVQKAYPSTPVSILGFNEVPSSGDQVFEVDEKFSKQVIAERKNKIKEERSSRTSGVTLDDFMNKVNEGKLKNLNLIIKADTQGSVEALCQTLGTIANEEVKVNIIHSGAGAVTESDVVLGSAASAIIICFNQKPAAKAKALAEYEKVEIREYKIIYEIVDDITNTINGMLTIKYEEKVIGHGEIRVVFKLSTAGLVAGSYITDGYVNRHSYAKVLRNDEEIGRSAIESLKIVKEEKSEVNKGFECGIKLKDNLPIKEGDKFEFYINEPIKRG